MRIKFIIFLVPTIFFSVAAVAQKIDRSEVKPAMTEFWDHEPEVVTPGETYGAPPSDAIILFDGTDFSEWLSKDGGEVEWALDEGAMTVNPGKGSISTKKKFGSIQLHIEWRAPADNNKEGQAGGNSGIFLMERYEVQVLNSHENRTYSNGQAASVYKQYPPLVNASRPKGEWQTYDIIFTAPTFKKNGAVENKAKLTVIHNGIVVQNAVELDGSTVYKGTPYYIPHGEAPIMLQDHGDLVSFRNIWVRALR